MSGLIWIQAVRQSDTVFLKESIENVNFEKIAKKLAKMSYMSNYLFQHIPLPAVSMKFSSYLKTNAEITISMRLEITLCPVLMYRRTSAGIFFKEPHALRCPMRLKYKNSF